jgi:hypothetical protein
MAGAILTVGLEMLCYMLSHEAHHRGGMYARASARIPVAERGGVRHLELGKLWKESDHTRFRVVGG